MKPLPTPKAQSGRPPADPMPSLPSVLPTSPGPYSASNRRSAGCAVQRVYPWLLSTSTLVAAVFCLLYITKPVIVPASTPNGSLSMVPHMPLETGAVSGTALLPTKDHLPGEKPGSSSAKPVPADPRRDLPGAATPGAFEETNLRIQHVLTAEAPGGHLDRIDLEVPVLYQSRHLRWTAAEVASAREILAKLMEHQEKTRQLRGEGVALLDAWNRLVSTSIPATDLRADSPSLPDNQEDAADSPRPAGWTSPESIQIQAPPGK
jgi:hypothetical protein